MAGLRHHEQPRERVEARLPHRVDERLVVVQLRAWRRQRVVGADRHDHLAAARGKLRQVGTGRVEPLRQLAAPARQRTSFDIIERVRLEVAHEKPGHAQHPKVRVHRGIGRRAFLPSEAYVRDQPATGWIGIRQPHAEGPDAVLERRGKRVAAVDELERRDLSVGQAGGGRGIGRIGIDVVRAALRCPRLAPLGALLDVEDGAARLIVVDDPIGEPVEAVALTHELAADRIDLGARHPVGERLLLNPDEPGREHQRREVDDGDIRDDAVVVVGIALRHRQRFAAALRRADVVVHGRLAAIRPLDEHHRRVARLLHLHVAEVLDRLVDERPLRRVLDAVARVAPVGDDALGRPDRAAAAAGEVGDDAVHPAAAELRGAQRPRRGQDDAEVDGFRRRIDGGHRSVDGAVRRRRIGRGRPPRLAQA